MSAIAAVDETCVEIILSQRNDRFCFRSANSLIYNGNYKWNTFVVEAAERYFNAVSARVIETSKKVVGMEIFDLNLDRREPDLFGRIQDARNGQNRITTFRPRNVAIVLATKIPLR